MSTCPPCISWSAQNKRTPTKEASRFPFAPFSASVTVSVGAQGLLRGHKPLFGSILSASQTRPLPGTHSSFARNLAYSSLLHSLCPPPPRGALLAPPARTRKGSGRLEFCNLPAHHHHHIERNREKSLNGEPGQRKKKRVCPSSLSHLFRAVGAERPTRKSHEPTGASVTTVLSCPQEVITWQFHQMCMNDNNSKPSHGSKTLACASEGQNILNKIIV